MNTAASGDTGLVQQLIFQLEASNRQLSALSMSKANTHLFIAVNRYFQSQSSRERAALAHGHVGTGNCTWSGSRFAEGLPALLQATSPNAASGSPLASLTRLLSLLSRFRVPRTAKVVLAQPTMILLPRLTSLTRSCWAARAGPLGSWSASWKFGMYRIAGQMY
jgi:hypothetical protein